MCLLANAGEWRSLQFILIKHIRTENIFIHSSCSCGKKVLLRTLNRHTYVSVSRTWLFADFRYKHRRLWNDDESFAGFSLSFTLPVSLSLFQPRTQNYWLLCFDTIFVARNLVVIVTFVVILLLVLVRFFPCLIPFFFPYFRSPCVCVCFFSLAESHIHIVYVYTQAN